MLSPVEILLILLIILPYAIFPFYLYLNKKHHARDSKAAIFPITNHFFQTICFTQVIAYVAFSSLAIASFFQDQNPLSILISVITGFSVITLIVTYFVITPVTLFLISYLAIHRSCLFFFPKFGEFMIPEKKKFFITCYLIASPGALIPLICYLSDSFSCIGSVISNHSLDNQTSTDNCPLLITNSDFVIFCLRIRFITEFSLIPCAFPYFIMIRRLEKSKHLISFQQSKPATFVFYQILIMLISRFILITIIIFESNEYTEIEIHRNILIISTMATFSIVQVSYIFSNKVNLDAILKIFECGKRFRSMDSTVSPEIMVLGKY